MQYPVLLYVYFFFRFIMNQIIEGIDNEVILVLFFFTTVIALVIPLYVLRPSPSNTRPQNQSAETTDDENNEGNNRNENLTSAEDSGLNQNTSNTRDTVGENDNAFVPNSSSSANDGSFPNNNSSMMNIKIKHNETTQEQTVSSSMLLKDLKQYVCYSVYIYLLCMFALAALLWLCNNTYYMDFSMSGANLEVIKKIKWRRAFAQGQFQYNDLLRTLSFSKI